MIYTPQQFLLDFVSLLQQHTDANAVRLLPLHKPLSPSIAVANTTTSATMIPSIAAAGPMNAGNATAAANGTSGTQFTETESLSEFVDIQVQFCRFTRTPQQRRRGGISTTLSGARQRPPPPPSRSCGSASPTATTTTPISFPSHSVERDHFFTNMEENWQVLASYRVMGSRLTISRTWCAQLQRLMSTAALLSMPLDDDDNDEHNVKTAAAAAAATRGNGDGGGGGGSVLDHRCRPSSTAIHFHVRLPALLPAAMMWCPGDDGFFGSAHYCTVRIEARRPSPGGGPVPQTLASLPTWTCTVGAVVNAELPLQGCAIQPGQTIAMVVLQSVDGHLCTTDIAEGLPPSQVKGVSAFTSSSSSSFFSPTAADDPLRSAAASSPSPASFSLARMQAFITAKVVPLVSLECLGGSWRRESSTSALTTNSHAALSSRLSLSENNNVNINNSSSSDGANRAAMRVNGNACGLAAIGSSYLVDLMPRRRGITATQVRNVVLVMDTPWSVWDWILGRSRSPDDGDADDDDDEKGEGGETGALQEQNLLASEMARGMSRALAQVVVENMDLFAFSTNTAARSCIGRNHGAGGSSDVVEILPDEDSAGGCGGGGVENGEEQLGASSRPSRRVGLFTDAMLQHTIAESIAKILFMSSNATFVHEAERLLFGSPSSGPITRSTTTTTTMATGVGQPASAVQPPQNEYFGGFTQPPSRESSMKEEDEAEAAAWEGCCATANPDAGAAAASIRICHPSSTKSEAPIFKMKKEEEAERYRMIPPPPPSLHNSDRVLHAYSFAQVRDAIASRLGNRRNSNDGK